MKEDSEFRKNRIEKLLHELKYEITRGMMEREIEEEMGFRFVVPTSKHFPKGVVWCEFMCYPRPDVNGIVDAAPRLTLVKK